MKVGSTVLCLAPESDGGTQLTYKDQTYTVAAFGKIKELFPNLTWMPDDYYILQLDGFVGIWFRASSFREIEFPPSLIEEIKESLELVY